MRGSWRGARERDGLGTAAHGARRCGRWGNQQGNRSFSHSGRRPTGGRAGARRVGGRRGAPACTRRAMGGCSSGAYARPALAWPLLFPTRALVDPPHTHPRVPQVMSATALAVQRTGEGEEGGRGWGVETLTRAAVGPAEAVPPVQRRPAAATSPAGRRCRRPSYGARPFTGTVVELYFALSWSRRRPPGTPGLPFGGGSRRPRRSPPVLFPGWSNPTAAARGLGLTEELREVL